MVLYLYLTLEWSRKSDLLEAVLKNVIIIILIRVMKDCESQYWILL